MVAVQQAYRNYGASIARRAHAILGDRDAAQDMVHEVFELLLERGSQIRDPSVVAAWLYSTTTRRCLNKIRDQRNRQRILGTAGPESGDAGQGKPRELWESSIEQRALVRQLLDRMPEKYSEVAVYHYLDEMTHEEIAEVLGCSRRHVGNLVRKAIDYAQGEQRDDATQ